ncbi:MAG: ketoacyl-ACP synthase III [Planctomycetes bacterium]|nr:ketoacyl-ACP synthase III [Planctomycetota bacterium]NUQ35322.1 ketoacyl-ACP synthase III [Planctomycetaceae bacterium]
MSDTKTHVGFLGVGSYAPERIVTNDDFAKTLDTSDEWIFSRTGIRERRFARDDEFTSDMGAAAARKALADAGLTVNDVDYVLVGTATPDNMFPSTAGWVTKLLGITDVGALDVSTACTGFIYVCEIASALIESGKYERILCIGADKLSTIANMKDRATCVLFGDAAGAAVIGKGGHRIVNSRCTCDFNYEALYLPAGGARMPVNHEVIERGDQYIHMNGREVYRFVVDKFVELTKECLERAKLKPADIALYIPHQANRVMLEFAVQKAGISTDKLFLNIDRYGNTSSASIPVALDEARQQGRIRPGDNVLLMGFGGGLSSGYMLLQW